MATLIAVVVVGVWIVSIRWVRNYFAETKVLMGIPWVPVRVLTALVAYTFAPTTVSVIAVIVTCAKTWEALQILGSVFLDLLRDIVLASVEGDTAQK